ncbi:MAG: hypothetical protein FJ027_24705, partial [Candidatus Rokubacteria bacterium]|nr:hypothetical protein [Candidatus Rokubacteria bacterium]
MPDATVRVWWLTKYWHGFGAAFGIGHSSLELGTEYITWLGAPGTSSSSRSSVSRSARSSSVGRSVSNSSESSSAVDSLAGLRAGTHDLADDNTTFGVAARQVTIPMHDATNPFGLRADAHVTGWWHLRRAAAGVGAYSALSTTNNCNAVVRQGLRKANSDLYATSREFSGYAGSNVVLELATAVAAQVTAVRQVWDAHRMLGSRIGNTRADGVVVPSRAQWLAMNGPAEVPDVEDALVAYHAAAERRVQLEHLRVMLRAICIRVAPPEPPPPAGPIAPVAAPAAV